MRDQPSGLLADGGIKDGQKYGKTNAKGKEIAEKPVTVPDFNATIANAVGMHTGHVVNSPTGRPFKVADKGTPITALF